MAKMTSASATELSPGGPVLRVHGSMGLMPTKMSARAFLVGPAILAALLVAPARVRAADSGSAPLGSLNYFDAVHRAMGDEAAGRTIALYLAPGVYHCSAGPTPARADYLSPLIAWREDGAAPGAVTLSIEASPTDAAMTKTVILEPHMADPNADRTERVGLAHYTPGRGTWCLGKGVVMACEPKLE